MVVQSAIDKLKDKPKDDRSAVAGGIAITVVIVLFVCWAIYFVRKIQNGSQQLNLSTGAQDDFNFTSVKQAQQQLQTQYSSASQDAQDLQDARDNANSQVQPTVQPSSVQPTDQTSNDQFGLPPSSQ